MHRLTSLVAVALLGGCAVRQAAPPTLPSAPFAAEPAPAPRTAAPLPLPASLAGLPTHAALLKDAKRVDGPLVLWQKDDKVWIELPPETLGRPYLLSPKIRSGIAEGGIVGGLMTYAVGGAGGPQVVSFVRVHNQIRLQAQNTDVTAPAGTPEARALETSYAHSLLGSAPLASQPHPETKAVLVEANAIFLTDIAGVGMVLQRAFRQGYGLDPRHTTISGVRGSPAATVIETQNHYYSSAVTSGGSGYAGLSGMPAPQVPRWVPDSRSLLVGMHYSLSPLPATVMAPRRADPRIGFFTTTVMDFADDVAQSPKKRYVDRWRLEKKDPAAALSEPVQPIAFWIDRNVPLAYRDAVRAGILEWNKAFEAIGFKDAIAVRQQPDDAAFDTLDTGVPAVRWMLSPEPGFVAIGQHHVDPRSGEILDAKIGFEGVEARLRRVERTQVLAHAARATLADPARATLADPARATLADLARASATLADPARASAALGDPAHVHGAEPPPLFGQPVDPGTAPPVDAYCTFADAAAEQLAYALDVLAARDEIDPSGPEAQAYVQDYVREVIVHEVGHALGLRHNFRASRAYTEAQLSDPEFTRAHGTSGSVMDYTPVNLGRPGQRSGLPFQLTLGPYDLWAIEYAYKPLPAATERAELQAIAARGKDPLLAFGTDEDNLYAADPEAIQFDLGSDPLVFAAKRLDIARDLFRRQETRQLPPDRDYAVLRRSLSFALGDVSRAVGILARQLGGVRALRDFPGSGRDPLQPVDGRVQRQALELMTTAVFAADGLALSPALQRRLAPDFLESGYGSDYALPQRLLDLQRSTLAFLLGEGLAARLLDSAAKFDRAEQALPLADVHARIRAALWSELDGRNAPAIRADRRELQREHVNRLAAALLKPQPRVDARALLRAQAKELLVRIDAVSKAPRRGADAATVAHLQDCADTLRQAMAAKLPRIGV